MFQLNYCHVNYNNNDYDRIYRPNGSGDYLFLLWLTPMKCYLNGALTISRENACILYAPGFCQDYQAVRKFRNSFVHFSTDLSFEAKYNIPVNQILYPDNFQQLNTCVQEIQQEYLLKDLHYEHRLQNLTEELFLQLSRSINAPICAKEQDSSVFNTLHNLRLKMLRTCEEDWTTQRLCQESSLSKSQFYHYYKYYFNTTPKAELIQARMDKIQTLLSNETLQIQQAAQSCGFNNINHFSRYFKEWYGCSPREYQNRKNWNP